MSAKRGAALHPIPALLTLLSSLLKRQIEPSSACLRGASTFEPLFLSLIRNTSRFTFRKSCVQPKFVQPGLRTTEVPVLICQEFWITWRARAELPDKQPSPESPREGISDGGRDGWGPETRTGVRAAAYNPPCQQPLQALEIGTCACLF